MESCHVVNPDPKSYRWNEALAGLIDSNVIYKERCLAGASNDGMVTLARGGWAWGRGLGLWHRTASARAQSSCQTAHRTEGNTCRARVDSSGVCTGIDDTWQRWGLVEWGGGAQRWRLVAAQVTACELGLGLPMSRGRGARSISFSIPDWVTVQGEGFARELGLPKLAEIDAGVTT